LIADEPTTALDVTTQAQIMNLLAELQRELGMSVIFITHNLNLAAKYTDEVAVMYGGKIVERTTSRVVLSQPKMPYTRALIDAMPRLDMEPHARLNAIEGRPPDPTTEISGCRFRPRCAFAGERCDTEVPPLEEGVPGHWWACWHPLSEAVGR
jgi:oligopeptide/dipeptide ABC transporter ATP-binding protein